MTEQEQIDNENTHREFEAWLYNKPPPPFLEWWRVENTGWSGGHSWFSVDENRYEARRFESSKEAIAYINREKKSLKDASIKWRYVHVTLERTGNTSITTETWTEI